MLEATVHRMVVAFRFLGWIWMLLLVMVILGTNTPTTRHHRRKCRGSNEH